MRPGTCSCRHSFAAFQPHARASFLDLIIFDLCTKSNKGLPIKHHIVKRLYKNCHCSIGARNGPPRTLPRGGLLLFPLSASCLQIREQLIQIITMLIFAVVPVLFRGIAPGPLRPSAQLRDAQGGKVPSDRISADGSPPLGWVSAVRRPEAAPWGRAVLGLSARNGSPAEDDGLSKKLRSISFESLPFHLFLL